jgi:hypothetical protein
VVINSLSQQFNGRKFGDLVLHHFKKQDFPTIVAALQGTIEELPQSARPSVESWIEEMAPFGSEPSFWQKDCGEVFLEICGRAHQKLNSHAVRATDDQLLSMFNIIVLNFAYGAHKHPRTKAFIQQSIGKGFLRRLFS